MESTQTAQDPGRPIQLEVAAATVDDVLDALKHGVRDMKTRPALSLFFGLVYALFGVALFIALVMFDTVWLAIPFAVGFPLVAPFLAAGLYEMSRRIENGERFTTKDVLGAIFHQQRSEFSWMAFVVLFVFWIWGYQVRIVLALTLQNQYFASLPELATIIFTTGDGLTFILVGSIIGSVLATILFSLTVISMPLLLHKQVDFVTAMITSVQTVLAGPVVMIGWGAVIGAVTLLAVGTGFWAIIAIFPVLGHTSWHLYRRLVTEVPVLEEEEEVAAKA